MAEILPRIRQIDATRARVPAPHKPFLHAVVIRAAAAFRRDPGDDLVGIGDVAGFAVDTVGGIQADAFAVGLSGVVKHFVDVGGTKILAWAAVFFYATFVAN